VLRLLSVSDISAQKILNKMSEKKRIILVEEVCTGSGIREALAYEMGILCPECRVSGLDLGRDFVPHGSLKELYKHCGLDAASIAEYTKDVLSK